MRNSVEKWLQNIWYSNQVPPWYLRMLVPLYRAGYRFDQRHSNSRPAETAAGIPLLVVGNISAGGSGKTPLVIALCNIAQAAGLKAGVASTGYGRKSRETLMVHAHSDAIECGDEPVLIAIRTGAPVIVASRRQDAIARLRQMNLNLIISDDGLQTAGLHRDIEICVVDGARGIGNGQLLPAGPLREPVSRLQDVDYIVSNGAWTAKPVAGKVAVMTLEGNTLCSLDGTRQLPADEFFRRQAQAQPEYQVHLFAGIGNPERFFATVRQLGLNTVNNLIKADRWHEHRCADHHAFVAADFDSVPAGAAIVMTEKDAVKCRKLGLENAWYLPVEAALDEDFVQWYRQQLEWLKQDVP